MSFRKFLTFERITIALIGLFFAASFLVVSNSLSSNNIFRDFLINLSAGSLMVPATYLLIDYLLQKEKYNSTRKGLGRVISAVETIKNEINSSLGMLLGKYDQKINFNEPKEALKFVDLYDKWVIKNLDEVDFMDPKTHVNLKAKPLIKKRLYDRIEDIDDVFSLYGTYLTKELGVCLSDLRKAIQNIGGPSDYDEALRPNGVPHTMFMFLTMQVYENLQKLEKEYSQHIEKNQ